MKLLLLNLHNWGGGGGGGGAHACAAGVQPTLLCTCYFILTPF